MTTADESLGKELTPPPGVTFDYDGKTYTLPAPFPMRLWLKLLLALKSDPGSDSAEWFTLNVAAHAEDMVCWATNLTVERFREAMDWQRVVDDIATQLGEEMADANPFSPVRLALDTLRRAGRFAQAMAAKAKTGPGGMLVS